MQVLVQAWKAVMEMALDYDMEEAPSSPPSPVVRE
jgi:hypothetical protein